MPNIEKDTVLIEMLKKFIVGTDRSSSFAAKLEVEMDEAYPEDDEIQDIVSEFACYKPGGGEYLFAENEMVKKCEYLIKYLEIKNNC